MIPFEMGMISPQSLVLSGGSPILTNSQGVPWSGSYVNANGDLTVDLRPNIAAESRAKNRDRKANRNGHADQRQVDPPPEGTSQTAEDIHKMDQQLSQTRSQEVIQAVKTNPNSWSNYDI